MSIYLKGNDFYIDYYFNGRRRREKIGPDKKLAGIVLLKRKVEIAEGKFLDIKKDTTIGLYEIIKDFLDYSQNSKRSYGRDLILAEHLKKFFGNKLLSEMTSVDVVRYRNKRLNTDNVKNATVNRETAFLKASFNLAINNKKATENPVRFVKKLEEPDGRKRYLSSEEIQHLLETCNKYFKPIIVCALTTGMRRNEMLDLKWKDVDMDRGIIHIENSKNGRPRDIPICGLLHKTLMECFEWSDGVNVFCSSNGKKYHYITSLWQKTVAKADISDFRMHDLRHTAASYLVMSGIDLTTVKEILGHKTLEMTLRYAHLSKSHVREAMEILGTKMNSMMDTQVDTKELAGNQSVTDILKTSSEKL